MTAPLDTLTITAGEKQGQIRLIVPKSFTDRKNWILNQANDPINTQIWLAATKRELKENLAKQEVKFAQILSELEKKLIDSEAANLKQNYANFIKNLEKVRKEHPVLNYFYEKMSDFSPDSIKMAKAFIGQMKQEYIKENKRCLELMDSDLEARLTRVKEHFAKFYFDPYMRNTNLGKFRSEPHTVHNQEKKVYVQITPQNNEIIFNYQNAAKSHEALAEEIYKGALAYNKNSLRITPSKDPKERITLLKVKGYLMAHGLEVEWEGSQITDAEYLIIQKAYNDELKNLAKNIENAEGQAMIYAYLEAVDYDCKLNEPKVKAYIKKHPELQAEINEVIQENIKSKAKDLKVNYLIDDTPSKFSKIAKVFSRKSASSNAINNVTLDLTDFKADKFDAADNDKFYQMYQYLSVRGIKVEFENTPQDLNIDDFMDDFDEASEKYYQTALDELQEDIKNLCSDAGLAYPEDGHFDFKVPPITEEDAEKVATESTTFKPR